MISTWLGYFKICMIILYILVKRFSKIFLLEKRLYFLNPIKKIGNRISVIKYVRNTRIPDSNPKFFKALIGEIHNTKKPMAVVNEVMKVVHPTSFKVALVVSMLDKPFLFSMLYLGKLVKTGHQNR